MTSGFCNRKSRAPKLLSVLLLLTVLAGPGAHSQVRQLGDVSFVAPEGWSYEGIRRGDFAHMIAGHGKGRLPDRHLPSFWVLRRRPCRFS